MPYTVWSHGRLLGETDLGFVRCIRKSRTGWFHPTPEGEKLMPLATGVPAALLAWGLRYREQADATGEPSAGRGMDHSTESADLAAATQHAESLELELRRADGSVVPTKNIGIRDIEEIMVRLAEEAEEDADFDDLDDMLLDKSDDDLRLEESVRHDAELILESFAENDSYRQWSPAEAPMLPRYQIQVSLVHDDAIP